MNTTKKKLFGFHIKKLINHITILKKLISFDTTSNKSNLDCVLYIQNLFDKNTNFKIIKIYDKSKKKCSILIKAKKNIKNGLLFAGHIDTVPTLGQKWLSNPYKAKIKNNKIYGRGSSDMKGFLSVILSNMLNTISDFPICLSITHDEETGCDGIYNLMQYCKRKKILLPDKCIVGEPTMLKMVSANKGVEIIETSVETILELGHSSKYNQKFNTITIGANLINFLQSIQNKIPKKNILNCSPNNSSIHIGIINGGTSHNIIPQKTSFRWELRYVKDDIKFVKNQFFKYQKKLYKNFIKIKNIKIYNKILFAVPALDEKNQKKIFMLMKKLKITKKFHVPFGTEAGIFQKNGFSTIIMGPGSIEQAHKPNEFISINQLNKFDILIKKMIR